MQFRVKKTKKSQCDATEHATTKASRTGTFVQNLNLSTIVKIYYSQLRLSHAHTRARKIFMEFEREPKHRNKFFLDFLEKELSFFQRSILCTSKCTTTKAMRYLYNKNSLECQSISIIIIYCC